MAEINQKMSSDSGRHNANRHGIKIDMTPMVDLAFLLLTFFILTRTFQEHHVMEVMWPDKPIHPETAPPVSEKDILNLVIAENGKLYWWTGVNQKAKATDFSKHGLRKLLIDQRKANPKIVLLIKPQDVSPYSGLVDVLDEVNICGMERYYIQDFAPEDEVVIAESLIARK